MKRLYLKNTKLLIFSGVALLAITVGAVVNVNLSMQNNSMPPIFWANVEALAQESGGRVAYECWQTISGTTGSTYLHEKTYCLTCTALPATSWSSKNTCTKN